MHLHIKIVKTLNVKSIKNSKIKSTAVHDVIEIGISFFFSQQT